MSLEEFFDSVLSIFFQKKWFNEGLDIGRFVDDAMNLGQELNDKERDFFICLLRKYNLYFDNHYLGFLLGILSQLRITQKNVYYAPLLAEKDLQNTTKSSLFVERQFHGICVTTHPVFRNKTLLPYSEQVELNDCKRKLNRHISIC